MRSDIVPGARFPDYELPDQDGVPRRLSDLQADQPMILVLARGHFCPKDHQQHRELVELLPRIDVAYTSIVTITTDDPATCADMRKATGATWPFLADPGRQLQRDLDVRELTDPEHDPMVPHTLVLAPGPALARRAVARPAGRAPYDTPGLRSHDARGPGWP
jgi:peroxiredoxin